MPNLTAKERRWLFEHFGERFTQDPTECLLYSHDISAMPSLISPLISNTVPDAIVKPKTEEELVELLRFAHHRHIPLTPRGKSSSGYGGAIPIRGGIVVDFFHFNNVTNVDKNNLTITVQAGLVWERLEQILNKQGLALRLYPTSAPSSTVGGWLAQGGAGIGSYQYGYLRDNVVSARIVTPSEEVKTISGSELDMVADAEGTTGFISEVTVKVRPAYPLGLTAVAFSDAKNLQTAVEDLIRGKMPIWSFIFINPRMAEMKNRSPLVMHHGHPAEKRVLLPAAYIVTLAYDEKDGDLIRSHLKEMAEGYEAEILSDEIAQHEWENRYKLMVVKRLGPSLVPAEVVVPLENLGKVMAEVEELVNQPVVKEGVVIAEGRGGKPEAVILGFIPSDQRKFRYNFVFGLVLTILRIARRFGGRPYSSGLYLTRKAEEILGKTRLKSMRSYKRKVDPRGVLNPGKVLTTSTIGYLLGLAELFEPLIRPLANTIITLVGERPHKDIRGIPGDIAWYAYACSQCGYCVDECDQYYGRGWESQTPRGKWFWLREFQEGRVKWDQKMVDTILACTTCELCNVRCSANLPIESAWMKLRGKLIEEDKWMTFPPFEMMASALRAEGDIWAGYRKDRDKWFPEELKARHGSEHKSRTVYFAGCTASYVEKDIALGTVNLLDAAGVDFTYLGNKESCCGTPVLVAGKWADFASVMQSNISAVKSVGADTVISSCPACDMMWRHLYPQWAEKLGLDYDIKVNHYSEIIAEKLRTGQFKFTHPVEGTVTWHDSCHIGRVSGIYEPPREIIKAIPGTKLVEMEFNRQSAHCCGSVLTLIKEPKVAAEIGEMRIKEAEEAGAQAVLALCPCCEFQLRVTADAKKNNIQVYDLSAYACKALGKELENPRPEVRRQWAAFDAMIALMTPQGFACLMDTMWPELLKSMPLGMGAMMKFIGKLGFFGDFMFWLMRPVFPVLFPLLLPGMMPKVMKTMLDRVAQMIPMPDYMAEQMPALMPPVMDSLMPHMVNDLVPEAVPLMVRHLRGKRTTK